MLHIETRTEISEPALRERTWEIYHTSLGTAQLRSPFRQYMIREEFYQSLDDPTFLKILLLSGEVLVSILLVATDMSRVSWLSGEYFAYQYPTEYANGQLMYFAGIGADQTQTPGPRGMVMMLNALIAAYRERNCCVLFHDYSALVHHLSGGLGARLAKLNGGEAAEVDTMHFWEIRG